VGKAQALRKSILHATGACLQINGEPRAGDEELMAVLKPQGYEIVASERGCFRKVSDLQFIEEITRTARAPISSERDNYASVERLIDESGLAIEKQIGQRGPDEFGALAISCSVQANAGSISHRNEIFSLKAVTLHNDGHIRQ
jgi:hypothetical protein